ncbi:hypothetical protein FTX61_00850 [Nitriliruptoraceae bacterium ZYF776]|nr:hypothetical protein [Profundirhabdus halotolerans]
MRTYSKLTSLAGSAVLALTLAASPVLAAEEPVEAETAEETAEAEADAHAEDEGGKIQLAETPDDRVGLLILGFLGAITVGGAVTAVRQIGGKRPQATGEFRWR